MKVWGLYSSCVDPYHRWELIQLFVREDDARMVKDMLAGKPQEAGSRAIWRSDPDEPEFDDLHVRALDLQ